MLVSGNPLRLEGNRSLLRQGVALLQNLTDELYAGRRGTWAPVGAQYRHILDHYQALCDGLAPGRVDYDARERAGLLETSRADAERATRGFLARMDGLQGAEDRPLLVQMDSGDGTADWRPSSLGRELQFLCSHTIHHFALIRLLLEGAGHRLPADFGTAPSTLAYGRALAR